MIVIVIVSVVRARAMSCTRAYTYLTCVSKKTNTLDKDIDLYRKYTFIYPLEQFTYIRQIRIYPNCRAIHVYTLDPGFVFKTNSGLVSKRETANKC